MSAIDWSGRRQEFSYGAGEGALQRRLPSGLIEYTQFDSLDRLRQIDLGAVVGLELRGLWREVYDLDAMDRVAVRQDSRTGRRDYQYDAAGQLLSVRGAGEEQFAYDPAGNRVLGGGRLVTYDARNRVVTDGVFKYDYDIRGNRAAPMLLRARFATNTTCVIN